MHDPDITTLRLYASVCETGSISRSAEQASLVGSAISKRLAQLEATVGVPLLVRRRRGVEPTAAGLTLLEHARTILASCDRIKRDMAGYAAGVRGQVRILATVSAMAESLPGDVADFLRQDAHRDVRIDLEERLSGDVVRGIRDGVAAIGVCWDVADFHGLPTIPYRHDHLAVVTHADHPLAAYQQVALAQTLDYDHVCMAAGSAVLIMLQRAAAQEGRVLPQRVTVSNFDSAFRVVQANLAISVVPREVALPYAQSHGLKVIGLTDAWAKRRFALCVRDMATLPPAARSVLEHLSIAGR